MELATQELEDIWICTETPPAAQDARDSFFRYPAKYRIGPHTHASDEHVTVISGGPFHLAVGDKFDDGARP